MNWMIRLAENMAWLREREIPVEQNELDRAGTYEYLSRRSPVGVLVEVGVYCGGSLLLLSEFVKPGGLLVGIDTFNAHVTDHSDRLPLANIVAEELRRRGQRVELLVSDSHAAVQKVKRLTGGAVDHLHIDADHSYDGVRRDFEDYSPMVVAGGLIQLHDAVNNRTGVPRLWGEIAGRYPGAVRLNHAGMLPVPGG